MRVSHLWEYVCAHGVGHPVPESVEELNLDFGTDTYGIHGCDGCCFGRTSGEKKFEKGGANGCKAEHEQKSAGALDA